MANSLKYFVLGLLIASSSGAENTYKSNCPEIINQKAAALADLIEGNELRFKQTIRCEEVEYKFENNEKGNVIVVLLLSQAGEWWHQNMALFGRIDSKSIDDVVLYDFMRVGGRTQDMINGEIGFANNEIILTATRPNFEGASKGASVDTELHYGIEAGRLVKIKEKRVRK